MARRYYSSTFTATTLASGVNATDVALSVAAVVGAPASLPWTGALDRGTASEELVTVTAVAGTNLTVTRGVDGTTGKSHSAGAAFEHVISARDVDEPNDHINKTSAAHAATAVAFTPAAGIAATNVQAAIEEVVSDANAAYVPQSLVDAKGDLLVGSADNTVVRRAIGANGTVLVADSAQASGVKWAGDTAWAEVGVGGAPAFQNSWVNVGGTEVPARYRKDAEGFVHIEMCVTAGTGGSVVFTLPVGYRPSHNLTVPAVQGGASYAYVASSGGVQPGTASGSSLNLIVSFYAG